MNLFKIIALGGSAFVALVVVLTFVFGSYYTVDQGEVAVVLTNGAISDVSGPGLHFKAPIFQSVATISLQEHNMKWEKLDTYSKDQQTTKIDASVTFQVPIDRVKDLYAKYGSVENMTSRLLDQRFQAIMKNVFGQYDAADAVQKRAQLNKDVFDAMAAGVDGEPIVIRSVQLTNMDFSDQYEASIEAKQQATVEVQKQQQILAQENIKAQIAVTQANGAAQARVAQAQAEAQAIKLKGDAEAAVISARAKALSDNPDVVQLIAAQTWDGHLPTTMMPGSALPFVNVPTPAPLAGPTPTH